MRTEFRNFISIFIAVLATLFCLNMAHAGKRIALVIGNSNYQHISPLANPQNDAKSMATTLSEAGFLVTSLINGEQNQMKRALLDFGRSLREEGVEAGLFYYAGHGVQVHGENYLVPVNAQIASEDEIDLEAINVNDFLQVMNSSNASINIVVLDACRNNPFAGSSRSGVRGLASVDAPKGTLIAYATAPGDVALDGDTNNSPYTAALTKAISNGSGKTIESVFKTARREVLSATNDKQVPWETSSITGDFYFHPSSNAGSDTKVAPPQVQASIEVPADPVIRHLPWPGENMKVCHEPNLGGQMGRLCASSILSPQSGNRYGSSNLSDNRMNTAWVEGVKGDGIGETLLLSFFSPTDVNEILLANGYNKTRDIYRKNGRVREFTVRSSVGFEQTVKLQDTGEWQVLNLPPLGKVTWVSLSISKVYRGSKYRDTAVSELRIK
ncbi:MAG: caspase family protein [Rhizobiaceae bacterium]